MLPKEKKLTRLEIENLKSSNKVISGKIFGLVFKPNNLYKFGLIISNKIAPLAVQRNKYKRIFYKVIKELPLKKRGFYLFLAKKNLILSNYEEIKKDISSLIYRV